MIFYHNNSLYIKKYGFHKFIGGSWLKVHDSFELHDAKERYMEIRNSVGGV